VKPEDSLQIAASAVEPVEIMRDSGFWHGMVAGFAFAVVTVQLWFAYESDMYRRVYDDMGASMVKPLVVTTWWVWSVPVVEALALAVLVVRRPRRLWWYAGLAGADAGLLAATWWLASSPFRDLGGQIQG
jgi:hypothetical protein